MQHLATSTTHAHNDNARGNGARVVSTDGTPLPLEATHLEAHAEGGIARSILTQTFVNHCDRPLQVKYLLPLPADGAVSGFSFTIGEQRIVGEVDRKERARERFEEAIAEGRSAAILDQERSNIFTQEIGNIPAGAKVLCEIVVDQPLAWLAEGAWEFRFPTVIGPRYMGAEGRVADAAAVTVPISDRPVTTQSTLELTIGDSMRVAPSSPSHPIATRKSGDETACTLRKAARLDRDLVVRWQVAAMEVGLSVQSARPSGDGHDGSAYALATLVPPTESSRASEPVARDLIALIDTSGSMGGQPLSQAKRVLAALVDSLGDKDQLELIEFSSSPTRWRPEPVLATRNGKKSAHKWIRGLRASGSTEMRSAIVEALRPLRPGAQRQVILITDGYIGFEQEIISVVLGDMPNGCRIHTVGVGSSVNRALTGPVAHAGSGVELVIGIGEDVEPVVGRLLKRTARPVVTELEVFGSALEDVAATHLPDLYAESPALLPIKVKAEGGTLTVRGRCAAGVYEHSVEIASQLLGAGHQGVVALYGREKVEELETRIAGGEPRAASDRTIEEIGLTFQISTRLTSWIAVGDEIEDSGDLLKVEMPHELPFGTSAEGFGLRASMPALAHMTTMTGMALGGAPAQPSLSPPAGPMKPSKKMARESKRRQKEESGDKLASFDEEFEGFAGDGVPEPLDEPAPVPSQLPSKPMAQMRTYSAGAGPQAEGGAPKAASRWPRYLALLIVALLVALIVYLLWGWLG